MFHMNADALSNPVLWQTAVIEVPKYKRDKMIKETKEEPRWLHFGAGNLFRAFPAVLADRLLRKKYMTTGIIVAEGYDFEIIDKIYEPHDNLSLAVTLLPNGNVKKTLVNAIAEALRADDDGMPRLTEIFCAPSLQMVSFTITEKGYSTAGAAVAQDLEQKPEAAQSFLGRLTALLYQRFLYGAYPLALVSMDNCSHNGDMLKTAVLTIATAWESAGFVPQSFCDYLLDPRFVAFPISMIDKITPRPDASVAKMLQAYGFADTETVVTEKNTYIAPFVNAEKPQYLVIEDKFPAGHPPLERVNVIFTSRETVEKAEKMKVSTCLNPLHTALAVFGCLLGYTRISDEMQDEDLRKLVRQLGYLEGLPVVAHPKGISPREFLDEVVNTRLPNPFMPDTPQRIATDTSQKMAVRFGETIRAYLEQGTHPQRALTIIPLVIAGWCRYLLGIDDRGQTFTCSPDPLLAALQFSLSTVKMGEEHNYHEQLCPILSNKTIFGVSIYDCGLGEKVECYFTSMVKGPGAVRALLHELVKG